jgi:hypothetical protein
MYQEKNAQNTKDKISSCFTMVEKKLLLLHFKRPLGFHDQSLVSQFVTSSFMWFLLLEQIITLSLK